MLLYSKSTCSTCRKAKTLLGSLGISFEERDLGRQPLTPDELDRLIGSRPLRPFLNFRNELYRERRMKGELPSREEAIHLMAENPNLIRRPLLVDGDDIVFGYDEPAYRALVPGSDPG